MSSKTLPLLPTEKVATYRRSLQAVVCDQSNQMSHSLCLPHSTQTHPQSLNATSVAVLSATKKDLKSISPVFTSKARPPLSLNQDFGHAVAIHDVPAENHMDHLPRQSLAILPMNLLYCYIVIFYSICLFVFCLFFSCQFPEYFSVLFLFRILLYVIYIVHHCTTSPRALNCVARELM